MQANKMPCGTWGTAVVHIYSSVTAYSLSFGEDEYREVYYLREKM